MDKEVIIHLVATEDEKKIKSHVKRFLKDKRFNDNDRILIINSLFYYLKGFADVMEMTEFKKYNESSLSLH